MYNSEVTRIPRTTADLWEVLEEQFSFVEMVLLETPVETEGEALKRKTPPKKQGWEISYRGTHADFDNRDEFLNLGRRLCPSIRRLLDKQALTPEFVQKWGMVMFCHGYIATYMLDDTDGLAHQRAARQSAAARSLDQHRIWFAHLVTRVRDGSMTVEIRDKGKKILVRHHASKVKDSQLTLQQVRHVVFTLIEYMLHQTKLPPGLERQWLKAFIGPDSQLANSFTAKKLSFQQMQDLVKTSPATLPPLDFFAP